MKKIIIILLPLFFIFGCSTSINFKIQSGKKIPVNFNSILERGGLFYEINSEKPF